MDALNILSQTAEFDTETLQAIPAVIELGELQLALVGGGTGDVVLP